MENNIRLGNQKVKLPGSRIVRVVLGTGLVVGGMFGFLPVLGFWMIPLGLAVLSVDLAIARRSRRRLEMWWGKRRNRTRTGSGLSS